ncbi:ion transporter [Halalkalibacter akibai]|uniref:Voltage-gated sodium channel n=1 Tax=Halalkalibacter akibai (strain ATCC 43226 / DSM 21942 / CIP 109018 / JCM 9157 / 1139) TaxID=1236973 RepID=W4QPG3_HALA3|nr:ion transporter [Halalkalibacter akibai]GAE33990.1 voltage-gated sodium channel [Halalkalibacter akibai JCM 9157]
MELQHKEEMQPSNKNSIRMTVKQLIEHSYFQPIVIGIILLNGLIIVTETYLTGNSLLLSLDKIIVWIFVGELILKLVGLGFKGYLTDRWNRFDFLIVVGSLVFYSTPFVSVLRLVRVLRLIRMIPAIPALRKIIDSLMKSVPALTGILGLSILIFSIYAIIGTTFFSEVLPDEFFGSFHSSLFTLLQVVTFESWASQVARPVINEIPWAWAYFVSFIIIGALVILNLVVAVILSYLGQDDEAIREEQMNKLFQENQELKKDIQEIKQLILDRK